MPGWTQRTRALPSPDRKGLLAYAARLVGDTLRDVAVRAAAQVLGPQSGLTGDEILDYPRAAQQYIS